MPPKLKVFQAHLGFYDTVVAVPSQAAALRAWGSRQNLFRDRLATPADDPKAVAAATAKPGVVLRRPAGSDAPFSENPDLPRVPDAPKKRTPPKVPKPAKTSKPAPPDPKPSKKAKPEPPDRTALNNAEQALAHLKGEEQRALETIAERKRALDEEARKTRSDFRKKREQAEKTLEKARNDYRRASGRA